MYGSLLFRPSAARTTLFASFPSRKLLGYYRSSANADWANEFYTQLRILDVCSGHSGEKRC